MAKSKKIYEQKIESVDADGVLRKQVTHTVTSKKVDVFYRTFVEHIALTNKLPYSELKLLRSIAAYVNWADNSIGFTIEMNKNICVMANITESTRRTALCRLVGKGFLIRKYRGCYILNPHVFFLGSEVERSNVISLEYRWELMDIKTADELEHGKGIIEFKKDALKRSAKEY